MDGQLIVTVKVHARWALEITIIEILWDLQPVIWEFLLMTSIIGDKRLASIQQFFLEKMINKARQVLPSYGKDYDNINKTLPFKCDPNFESASWFYFLKNEIYGNSALFFLLKN